MLRPGDEANRVCNIELAVHAFGGLAELSRREGQARACAAQASLHALSPSL